MFGIELTLLQKLEIAFICLVLGIAGFLLFRNWGTTFDQTVTSFTQIHHHPVVDNPGHTAPVTATNPADPKKDEWLTYFACSDGKLKITEFRNDSSHHPTLAWEPETRLAGHKYQYYQDPMAPVAAIKDPFRHALAFATYSKVYLNRSLGLLGQVGLTPEQLTQADQAFALMSGEIKLIDSAIDGGTFASKLMDNVMKALAAYNAKAGDPTKDPAKADLAHKVLDAATAFFKQEYADKDKSIDKYMDATIKILNADQQQKLINAYNSATAPRAPAATPATRRTPAPPATARANRGTAPRTAPPARTTTPPAGG